MEQKTACHMQLCVRCVTGEDKERASASRKRKACKRIKNTPNPQARRPRSAHGQGIAARDVTSESDEDEEERVEWGTCKYIRKKHAKNSYHMICHHTLSKNGIISYHQIDISYQKIYISYPRYVISYLRQLVSYAYVMFHTY